MVSLNERNPVRKRRLRDRSRKKEIRRKKEKYVENGTKHVSKVCLSMLTNSASARGRNTKTALRSIGQFGSMGPVGCHVGPLPSLPLLLDLGGHYGSPLPLHHRPQHLPVSPTPYIW